MSNLSERLKMCLMTGSIDQSFLPEVIEEIGELRKKANELEELLIMIVRTGWPWDEDGEPNEIFRATKDGYVTAMIEARELLGLSQRSKISRTEPKT